MPYFNQSCKMGPQQNNAIKCNQIQFCLANLAYLCQANLSVHEDPSRLLSLEVFMYNLKRERTSA